MIQLDSGVIRDFLDDMDINVQIVQKGQLARYEDTEGRSVIAQLYEITAHAPGEVNGEVREVLSRLKIKVREERGDANTIIVLHLQVGHSINGSNAVIACAFVNAKLAEDPRTLRVRRLVEREERANIGDVAHALTLGYRCTRPCWDGDAFVYLQKASEFKVNREPLLGIFPEGTNIKFAAHIDQYRDDGSCRVWTPSVEDLLATDWTILPHQA